MVDRERSQSSSPQSPTISEAPAAAHDDGHGAEPGAAQQNLTLAEQQWRKRTAVLAPRYPRLARLKDLFIGGARNPFDKSVFRHLSLIAFFAWVGLGADGLSSSCYGPREAFAALGQYRHLSIFIALASAITVFVISTSYAQIIELFPSGGGGYLVASKLLSPRMGMVSGSALLLDYVLTISISVADGANALFSFLPQEAVWHGIPIPIASLRLPLAIIALLVLTLMNLRGIKESVLPLVPIFLIFVFTHAAVIVVTMFVRFSEFPAATRGTISEVHGAATSLGIFGMLFLLLRAYSMGAGTYTGIEAVSNGLPILREPRVATGKRTMRYMAASLAITVAGLMLAYVLFDVHPQPGKTLNAVLFGEFTKSWPHYWGVGFVIVTLLSEAAILFVAAQAGFLDGPRVLSNMALDRWFPHRFATLSDRLVTENGILLMGAAALVTLILTRGDTDFLVILYSINVFITFSLSQAGMVRHWWQVRGAEHHWRKKLLVNGVGLVMCVFILVSVICLKFTSGGYVTILLTISLIVVVLCVRRHYDHTNRLLKRLDALVNVAEASVGRPAPAVAGPAAVAAPLPAEPATGSGVQLPPSLDVDTPPAWLHSADPAALTIAPVASSGPGVQADASAKTAVLMVNGFNGLGLHTLFSIVRIFGGMFRNFVIVEVGLIDVGNFKGASELGRLNDHVQTEVKRYVDYLTKEGYFAEGYTAVGLDIVDEIATLAPAILRKFPSAVFFGGQLVFPNETPVTRFLHNNTVFAVQRRFYNQGIPVVVLPIRV